MANTPTLINLPPPPSDPVTPSDMGPGTPNSGTTTMSELSTVAIKDGHRGHLPHHQLPLEAERADRISRLAGLERIAAARQGGHASSFGSVGAAVHSSGLPGSGGLGNANTTGNAPVGYFDASNNPAIMRERSTVGSASATGSVGGRTTWASGSDAGYENPDKMSEDQDQDGDRQSEMMDATSSVGGDGFSDEAASLVGFGEGARTPARQQSVLGSPTSAAAKPTSALPPHFRDQYAALQQPPTQASPQSQSQQLLQNQQSLQAQQAAQQHLSPAAAALESQQQRRQEGAPDTDVTDTAAAADMAMRRNQTTAETTERIMRERAQAAAAAKGTGADADGADAMRE